MPNSGMNARGKRSDEWCTPPRLFAMLDSEFNFTLDGAATRENAKCERYCGVDTPNPDELWTGARVFCNPPYSRIQEFVERAFLAQVAVLLLPVRTDTDWFHLLIERKVELRWLRKRVRFLENGVAMGSPRFASLIAVVRR